MDGGRTDVLLLLLARDARQYLRLLAKTTRLCRQPGFRVGVRGASPALEVVNLVRDTERRLFSASATPLS